MRLHLVRHAKTSSISISGKDFDRKLIPNGHLQASELAIFLKEAAIKPRFTFCSNAQRTKETLNAIVKKNDLGKIAYTDDLYLCDSTTFLNLINALLHSEELMIIGHNDGISTFASYLTDEVINMQTCSYLCIEFNLDSWQEISKGTGTIIKQYRPSLSHL